MARIRLPYEWLLQLSCGIGMPNFWKSRLKIVHRIEGRWETNGVKYLLQRWSGIQEPSP